jgi:hypothetical protein
MMRPAPALLACFPALAAACGGAASQGAGPAAQGVCALPAVAGPPAEAGACLGAGLLAGLARSHLLVGLSGDDAAAAAAPYDLRYQYLAGPLPDGTGPCASCASGCTAAGQSCANGAGGCGWWGCWQYDQLSPGQFAVDFVAAARGRGQIPMITYYLVLQASGVLEGTPEATQAAADPVFMARYLADWRFLLQRIGSETVFLHLEPDFWGYAQHASLEAGRDPSAMPAAVASANPEDCGGCADTLAGLGHCLVGMVRKYAPNARVGLHASGWGTRVDVLMNASASFDVPAEARKLGTFLRAVGAAAGDYVVADMSDRDAGYYQSLNRDTWWDAANTTLPDFHQAFAWAAAVAETVGRPVLWWQIPVGNLAQGDTSNHWRDNRVDYLMAHPAEVAAAHGVGLAFGAGAADQTTPSTDGGNLAARVQAYAAGGGQALCP